MPIIYTWITVDSFPSPRAFLMAALVTIWGMRLSYNFYRKGGYNIIPWKGVEDYRWKVMRENPVLNGRIRFGLFNLFFISFYQNILILLISTPILLAAINQNKSLTIIDLFAALFMLIFIITETIADNQLFRFHQEKQKKVKEEVRYSESIKKGFMTQGAWKYVRHPNFASEQLIWISFYLFGVAASGQWINYTLAGPLLLVLLFAGSSRLTESISSRKYPEYAVYQKVVPKFIPLKFSRSK
jgi:steroid 5-alpha reductase family enzyme